MSRNDRPSALRAKNQLRLANSLNGDKKEPFVPNDRKVIKWYCCGPTVYDAVHLGHARCYITFDFIRRIMTDYFGYHVFFVMNITDIDDKIIKRARSNYLCDKFIDQTIEHLSAKTIQPTLVLQQIGECLDNYKQRRAGERDKDKKVMIETIVKKSKVALDELGVLLSTLDYKPEDVRLILERLRDVIADEEDTKLAHTVNEHQIFKNLTITKEQEFHKDMQRLGVLPPNALPRVSEYIEETGAFVSKLEQNGFAYRSGNSIYFDIEKFDSDERHRYAKLVRSAYEKNQPKKNLEGEGELFAGNLNEKKSVHDFVVWKESKVGEPRWQTQDFMPGRPGWHIECSVMASKLLGENFDIHSGGCDLKFPHHDNEMALAEAYYNTGNDWVNYFIHTGHLTISGCKMSKSLKNFITLDKALQKNSPRQLRFAFLAHSWSKDLDFNDNTMRTAENYENKFADFLKYTTETLRRSLNSSGETQSEVPLHQQLQKWSEEDFKLNEAFLSAITKLDKALCDSFDTRAALEALRAIMKECRKRKNTNVILLRDIFNFVRDTLSTFGVSYEPEILQATQDNKSSLPNEAALPEGS